MLRIANIMDSDITTDAFGGKAFGLSLLHKAGLLIPNTIAIEATDQVCEIDNLAFQQALRDKLATFSDTDNYNLAVRSSCTNEDDFSSSMAGHFDTYLGNMEITDILTNIKNIIKGLETTDTKMGIVIQQKVEAEYAGVLFSSDPVSYSKKQMVISYTSGLGDKLVSGKTSGTDVVVTIDGDVFTPLEDTSLPIKDDLITLAKESKQLERSLMYPLDIEWAMMGSDIYFLQCRPLASITGIRSTLLPVNKRSIAQIPAQLVSHDKIKLRLSAQESDTFISDAYIYIRNSCLTDYMMFDISKSEFCKGYSAVIIYPQRLSNKVIRSFIGDKKKVLGSVTDCCRYGIRSFPEYDNLDSCLNGYFNMLSDEYWISTTIIQEIFDPLYTGVIQRIAEGFIVEITRGHFLTKGVVPTSQYIISKDGLVIERTEVTQQTWLKIIEGHVVHCICNNGENSLVSLNDCDIKRIIECFNPILETDSNVVEFGLLKQPPCALEPYLIDFVDENSPINISSADIKSGIISYGYATGKPIFIKDTNLDSLNEHFHNITESSPKSNEKVIFFCQNPELSLLDLLEKYDSNSIGFVFQNCAIGAHLAVVLREKGIPAIKLQTQINSSLCTDICMIDAKTPDLLPKERLKYE